MTLETKSPRLHVARSFTALADGKPRQYAYLRYEVWDEKKGRYQPKPLASLGRADRLDEDRLQSLEGFLKEWLRKDSSLPFDALQERFKSAEPAIRILCSRDFGLRWILEQAWAELGYKDAIAELTNLEQASVRADLAIFAMVLVQLVAPQSKRRAATWKSCELFFPEGEHLSVADLYRGMDVLAKGQTLVEKRLKERLEELKVPTVQAKHDTTAIPFATRYDDEERAELEAKRRESDAYKRGGTVNDPPLRMRGHSKNKRPDLPQIVLEAVVGDHGLVVHHATHAGNTSDTSVTRGTLEELQALGYRDVQWTGDSGTNSVANREALRAANFDFVLGEGVSRTAVVRRVLKTAGRYRQHPERPELSYKCVITEATDEDEERKRLYVIRRNASEEEHTLRRLEIHLERVKDVLDNGTAHKREALLHHRSLRRYVRPDGRYPKDDRPAGKVLLDSEAIARIRSQAGKSVIATDVCDADPIEVDDLYRSLFDVERLFRQLKSTLRVGPIRHRRADRIRAHVTIAVMANNLARWVERKAGMTLESLQLLFDNLRVQEVRMGEATYWQCVELEAEQRAVIKSMGYELPPTRFTVTVPP